MFCKHCGKEVADGAKFCTACGQPTGEARPASSAGLPPIVESFIDQIKGIANPTEAVGLAAKSVDFTGIIGIGLFYLVYLFYNTISAFQASYSDVVGFGGMFAISLAMGAIELALLFGAFYGVSFVAYGAMPNPTAVINSFGFALIPSVVAMCLNFGLGFVWSPLANFVSTAARIFMWLILYVSVQKGETKPVRSYFWVFCGAVAFASVLASFINNEIYSAYLLSCIRYW